MRTGRRSAAVVGLTVGLVVALATAALAAFPQTAPNDPD